jgi:hypothetical protein
VKHLARVKRLNPETNEAEFFCIALWRLIVLRIPFPLDETNLYVGMLTEIEVPSEQVREQN